MRARDPAACYYPILLSRGRARRKRESAAMHHMMLRGLRQAPAPALPEPNQRDTATGVRFWVFKCK